VAYWVFSAIVVLFGIVTGFSIGVFILPIGLALVVLGPVRKRPRVYWPGLMAVVGFVLGVLLYGPLTCTSTAMIPDGVAKTVCTSILGPEYRGFGTYSPSFEPARNVGLIMGVGAALLTFAIVRLGSSGPRAGNA
jgi:hypothetical protein